MTSEKADCPFEDRATIISQLQKFAVENPVRPAYIFVDKNLTRTVLTRQDVWDKSRRFAGALHRLGIVKGDVVCNTLPNSPQRLISTFGTILSGAASMHGQILLADGEDIINNWKDSKCKAIILDPHSKFGATSILDKIKVKDDNSNECHYKDLPHLTHIIPVVMGNGDNTESCWPQALDGQNGTYTDDSITKDDVAYIFTTSGSTGFAKLVPHTHGTSLDMGTRFAAGFDPLKDSVYLNNRSLGWNAGYPYLYPVSGVTRVLMDNTAGLPKDLGATILSIFNQENCDCCFIVPSVIPQILKAMDAGLQLNRRLRVCFSGGNTLTSTHMKAIGRFTDVVSVAYGATEVGVIYSMRVQNDDVYENTCVGFPGKGVEVRVLGNDMVGLPVGATGEILIRTPTVTKCYLNNPEASTYTFLADGWYRTSDMGHVNEKGQLFVYCRKANAINHQGFIHYPGWMEARINKHPDILKCAVVGIPDADTNEEFCLCIVQSPQACLTPEDVREFCKNLFLTSEKDSVTPIPKFYLYFEEFPENSNGKLDRKMLRAEACKRLGVNI